MQIQFTNSETRSTMVISTLGRNGVVVSMLDPGKTETIEIGARLISIEMLAFDAVTVPLSKNDNDDNDNVIVPFHNDYALAPSKVEEGPLSASFVKRKAGRKPIKVACYRPNAKRATRIFESQTIAAEKTGIERTTICAAANHGGLAGGYLWKKVV